MVPGVILKCLHIRNLGVNPEDDLSDITGWRLQGCSVMHLRIVAHPGYKVLYRFPVLVSVLELQFPGLRSRNGRANFYHWR